MSNCLTVLEKYKVLYYLKKGEDYGWENEREKTKEAYTFGLGRWYNYTDNFHY
jgi:hypothetical protein